MKLLVIVFVIAASLIASNSVSSVHSKPLNAENTDYEIFDDIIPESIPRNAIKDPTALWPNGIVPFKIDKEFDDAHVEYIHRAMQAISRVSCVKFIDAPANATTFVSIRVSLNDCQATLGYRNNSDRHIDLISYDLDTGCFKIGIIIHELMHVLGFTHQHTTPDRDKYIKIIYENMKEQYFSDFEKLNPADVTNLGLPYDFGSVMHYPLDAFSKNGNLTIQPIADPGPVIDIGNTDSLSRLDILKINKLYKCCE